MFGIASLGQRTDPARAPGTANAGPVRQAVCATWQERCSRCGSDLRSGGMECDSLRSLAEDPNVVFSSFGAFDRVVWRNIIEASTAFPNFHIYGSCGGIDLVVPSVNDRVAVQIIDELQDALFEFVFRADADVAEHGAG